MKGYGVGFVSKADRFKSGQDELLTVKDKKQLLSSLISHEVPSNGSQLGLNLSKEESITNVYDHTQKKPLMKCKS